MRSIYIIITLSMVAAFSGCGGDAGVNNANTGPANANVSRSNASNVVAVTTPTPEAKINDAPTLTPVYKAYCAAMERKDEAALRRIYSSDTIKFFETEMKAEGVKSLTEYLADDQVSSDLCEVSNEKITGDTAVGKIRSRGYPNGIDVVFVKENGEWKLTNRQPGK